MGTADFTALQNGINRLQGFIIVDSYFIDHAIVSASKVAYVISLLESKNEPIEKFDNPMKVKNWMIQETEFNKLNKLKQTSPEAFYYWKKTLIKKGVEDE